MTDNSAPVTEPEPGTPAVAPSGESSHDGRSGTRSEARSHRGQRGVAAAAGEYVLTFLVALVVAVLIKTFLVQPFFIPSASMRPTLMEDDKILVSKLHPGVIDIQRGDVIVFEDPGTWVSMDPNAPLSTRQQISKVLSYVGLAPDPSQNHLVKRLIGVGGDHIVCEERGGPMSLNGHVLDEPYISPDNGACQTAFDVVVPEGSLWVMGDNRFNSADSAEHEARGENGFVDADLVTGKAVLLFLPLDRFGTLDNGADTFADINAADPVASAPARGADADTLPALALAPAV